MKASTRFPGTTGVASSRRSARRFNRLYDDDFHNNQIKMLNRSRIFSKKKTSQEINWCLMTTIFPFQPKQHEQPFTKLFKKQSESKLVFDDNNISLSTKTT
jgi:hypothetical protein